MKLAHTAIEHGRGILRLAPNWVPRSFCVPGRRIKLHPDDYYALGGNRGGIDERCVIVHKVCIMNNKNHRVIWFIF